MARKNTAAAKSTRQKKLPVIPVINESLQAISPEAQGRAILGNPFPVKVLMVALVVPMIVIGILGWYVWNTYWTFQKSEINFVRLREIHGRIIYLDEVSTTSARMAVATGNNHWEKRYLGFMPQREVAMTAARKLAPGIFDTEEAQAMHTSKRKLLELEARALDAVRTGRRDLASVLVFGSEYEKLKKVYDTGTETIATILQEQAEAGLLSQRKRTLLAVFAVAVALPVLLFAWFGILRMIGNYIRERKKAEDKIREAMDIKYAFTSMVSHELRTPLAAIKENIDIVLDKTAGETNADQEEFLNSAKRNVDRLGRLINDVLDYQKLESQRMAFHMGFHNINDVIRETVETMRNVINTRGLRLHVDLSEDIPMSTFDRDKIIQVVLNLINNAIKFTGYGSLTIVTTRTEEGILTSVKDTGIGIHEEDMPKLFRSFSQIGDSSERKSGGTGLGLAISKQILNFHGGRIWAESNYGQGSIFSFLLPVTVKSQLPTESTEKVAQ